MTVSAMWKSTPPGLPSHNVRERLTCGGGSDLVADRFSLGSVPILMALLVNSPCSQRFRPKTRNAPYRLAATRGCTAVLPTGMIGAEAAQRHRHDWLAAPHHGVRAGRYSRRPGRITAVVFNSSNNKARPSHDIAMGASMPCAGRVTWRGGVGIGGAGAGERHSRDEGASTDPYKRTAAAPC
jgi:hypothetical protein